jgi:deoxyribodipyrimidine photolyase-related protein
MSVATVILPHQLFASHPALIEGALVYLIEEPLFFTQYAFHAQKLIYHRASMKHYEDQLRSKGYTVRYVDAMNPLAATESWVANLQDQGVNELHMVDPVDYMALRRVRRYINRTNIRLVMHESPNFNLNTQFISEKLGAKKRFFLTAFYIEERKRLSILLDGAGDPVGGQWTFDESNRKKMPKNTLVPPLRTYEKSHEYLEAVDYVARNFPLAPGLCKASPFPLNHEGAKEWLDQFCEERLSHFGDYQDALHHDGRFLFHSVLTPMLNIGLLSPMDVVHQVISIGTRLDVPMNNIEGFVRQVMGWREFIRAVYQLKGVEARKRHFWNHHQPMPASFWKGNTGIPPLDDMIRGVLDTAYAHHIERLMVAGNFMLLCEIDCDEVHEWFMSLFIDAYDWVMVPNVYGMSQYADGGLMSTKPYISGSNYILKMSHYKRGPWCDIWDGLFWRFIHKHRDFFTSNPRLSMMVRIFDKMDEAKRHHWLQIAESYLVQLHGTKSEMEVG